jgi:hypothetical protein
MMMIGGDKKLNMGAAGMPGNNQNNNSSFAGKKVLPNAFKNPKKLYVSPYS